jgi:NAD(P)-dependent dehydrogenase (short-subunit alcohol dehydrogenase family)
MEGFAGKIAVVTGAGSGIGQALSIELAHSGAKLAISDVDTDGLAHTEDRLKAIGAPVKADRLDVTERDSVVAYAQEVKEHFGVVNQIYNNAGICYVGDIEISPFKDIERVTRADAGGATRRRIVVDRLVFSVSARFAAACMVFFSAFFALPLWLLQFSRLGAVETGVMMASMVIVSAITTPMALRTESRSGPTMVSLVGAGGLCVGMGLLATVNAQTSMVVPLAAIVGLGASHAFNNLGLQAELTAGASPARLGTAAGFFQAARFIGAALATGLLGITVADDTIADDWRRLWIAAAFVSIALLGWSAMSWKRARRPWQSRSAHEGRLTAPHGAVPRKVGGIEDE